MAVAAEAAAGGPRVHPGLSERLKVRLNEAIPVAREHLREYPGCQALFEHLGADGLAQLARTSYHPASRQQQRRYCRRHSHAVTEVGGSRVIVCRSFARLSPQQAAVILIHEALHGAGQTEYPTFSNAPDALEITEMVTKGCRFF